LNAKGISPNTGYGSLGKGGGMRKNNKKDYKSYSKRFSGKALML
jgi:hypothetical protein